MHSAWGCVVASIISCRWWHHAEILPPGSLLLVMVPLWSWRTTRTPNLPLGPTEAASLVPPLHLHARLWAPSYSADFCRPANACTSWVRGETGGGWVHRKMLSGSGLFANCNLCKCGALLITADLPARCSGYMTAAITGSHLQFRFWMRSWT